MRKHLIDKFFFIRYQDPDYHIRLRLLLSEIDYFGEVFDMIRKRFISAVKCGKIWKIQVDMEKSEYAVTPFKLNEMPKINEISHFAHIDYQAFAINDCSACF